MKRFRRARTTQSIIVALRNCITPRCDNATPSFYCDDCWTAQQERRRTA